MIKRKINPEYLRRILSGDIRSTRLYTDELAKALERFADGYLKGVMNLTVHGDPGRGYVNLNMSAFSYLIRLLCEDAEDEPTDCTVNVGDKLTIITTHPAIKDHAKTAHLISVAKLVGFKVSRIGEVLTFTAPITPSFITKVYAMRFDDIYDMLVLTYKM